MFTRSKDRNGAENGDAHQPLLADEPNSAVDDRIVFAVDDHDDVDEEHSALAEAQERKPEHGVRFQEDVQVIAPSLRSTISSREAEYELDTDDIDDETMHDLESTSLGRRRDQSMPLLVGLVDASAGRRSLDGSIPLHTDNGYLEGETLDEIAAKRQAGGGMIDSVANMANSILGAGPCISAYPVITSLISCRDNRSSLRRGAGRICYRTDPTRRPVLGDRLDHQTNRR
ncbi:hypothetical protein HGRIS_002107 [Hohenbuehelia grisea]|uniref:Uncharacterized protein n=1 Tax=Hohenbuehelia grisea TaxID=104357 RepID=A0ABR3JLD3_9AGAR